MGPGGTQGALERWAEYWEGGASAEVGGASAEVGGNSNGPSESAATLCAKLWRKDKQGRGRWQSSGFLLQC